MARGKKTERDPKPVTLKVLAERLGLSPATVSVVLNRSPVADSIPPETQERVFAVARELQYRPSYLGRSLRGRRSHSVGVLVPEISEGYAVGVMTGVERRLIHQGYFYLVASHRFRSDLVDEYLRRLEDRSVEGFLVVAGRLEEAPKLPTVVVSGHRRLPGVTSVDVDHDRGAALALAHLADLGHERVAFFKGHPASADTADRWRAIGDAAAALGLELRPRLCLELGGEGAGEIGDGEIASPRKAYREGYALSRELLARASTNGGFTALFAFNDVSAIGAVRGFRDAGLRVPEDVSVVGFDDVESATLLHPGLTTVRQPLREMGEIAAEALVERLGGESPVAERITVEPELIVRGTTGPPPAASTSRRKRRSAPSARTEAVAAASRRARDAAAAVAAAAAAADPAPAPAAAERVTLKDLARHLELSPSTVSVVLNRAPVASSIPRHTQERVFAAARELGYRPNHLARSLRGKRSRSVGLLVPEISGGYVAGVLSGVEGRLARDGYSYLMASHRSSPELVEELLGQLEDRVVEGFVLVATPIAAPPPLPTVIVSGHRRLEGVTNVVVDHDRAAALALSHLVELGHERVAFFKGHAYSADTESRWRGILRASAELGLEVRPELSPQLVGNPDDRIFSAKEGYREGEAFARALLEAGEPFTALFAFNDVSALGAVRAFLDAGLRVPEDVSVVGFDDIASAEFHHPGLTTVRQPLREMGEMAAGTLLERLAGEGAGPAFVTVEPELVVRESTGPPPARLRRVVAS